jgi:Zn-dependent peptidase ImmA (M78 family)
MDIERNTINQLADNIRVALDMIKAPYKPREAIDKLGGSIEYDFLERDIDAYIKKVNNDNFKIVLNYNISYERRENFSLAHELGHLFLHMGFIIDSEKWNSLSEYKDSIFYRNNKYSLEEFEANEFAAAFLMPKNEFIMVAEENLENNQYNLAPISEYFDVSLQAVANRGKWLGIFEW